MRVPDRVLRRLLRRAGRAPVDLTVIAWIMLLDVVDRVVYGPVEQHRRLLALGRLAIVFVIVWRVLPIALEGTVLLIEQEQG